MANYATNIFYASTGKSTSDWPRKPNEFDPLLQNKIDPSNQNKNDPIEMYVKIDFYVIP